MNKLHTIGTIFMRSVLNIFFKKFTGLLTGMVFLAATALAVENIQAFPKQGGAYLACRVLFEYYFRRDAPELEKQSRSGESGVYYFTSYYLNGLLSAVEATGSDRLLRRAMRYVESMIATSRVLRSGDKTYRAWGPFVISPQSDILKPNVHYTLQAMVPVARLAAI